MSTSPVGPTDEAARPALTPPSCGTRHPGRPRGVLLARLGHWDRRDFTYAFTTGPGITDNPPGPAQSLTTEEAQEAVRRAFDTWELATSPGGSPIQLRFTAVDVDNEPDIIVEWVAARHAEGGPWTISDDLDMTVDPANGLDGAGAHADFPPVSIGGLPADDALDQPPVPLHFNDDSPVAWNEDDVERIALHEIGHVLGLEHVELGVPDGQPVPPAVMQASAPFNVLQDEDRRSIEQLYSAPGPERFTFVWMQGTLDRASLWGVSRDELHEAVEAQQEQGFRLMRVNAYVLPSDVRYNAIFEKIAQQRHYVTDRSRDNFDQRHDELTDQGFRLLDVTTFVTLGGDVRYNGVWAADDVRSRRPSIGVSAEELAAEVAEARDRGFYPTAINGYATPDGDRRWNALFVAQGELGEPRDWKPEWGLSRAQFRARAREYESDGYLPTDANAFVLPAGGGERWNGTWERLDLGWHAQGGWARVDAERRAANVERDGLAPWVLHAYVLPATQTTAHTVSLEETPPGLRGVVLGLACDDERLYATRYYESTTPPHSSTERGSLLVVDPATLRRLGDIPVGHKPRAVAVNPVTGLVYVVNAGATFGLSVVDPVSGQVRATVDLGQGPFDVAVNPVINRIYVSNWLQRRIHVIDGSTHRQLEPILIGPGPTGLAVDASSSTVYVALHNRSFAPNVNGLGVIIDDGRHREIRPVVPIAPLLTQSVDVAVDADRQRMYVANLGGGGVQPSITVLRAATLTTVATIPMPAPARAITVHSDAWQVYVGTDAGVHVIDTGTLVATKVTAAGAGRTPWAVAAAPGTMRQLYVGDARTGDITRLT